MIRRTSVEGRPMVDSSLDVIGFRVYLALCKSVVAGGNRFLLWRDTPELL